MKKPKYKEVKLKTEWFVVADYQPSNMWMRPDDTKTSGHETPEDAMAAIEGHKEKGASGIALLHRYLQWEKI